MGREIWPVTPLAEFRRNAAGQDRRLRLGQHMIKSLAPKTGRMAVVLPHGALFRMGKEGEIREKILGMDLLEAVIGLGPNLFYGTGLAACILIFRQRKAKDRKNKVLNHGRLQGVQDRPGAERIAAENTSSAFTNGIGNTSDGIARVVTLEEIAGNDYNLNIPRYVEPKNDQVVLTVDDAMKQLRTSAMAAFAAEEKLITILRREGLLK